jgi:hypothetical protein
VQVTRTLSRYRTFGREATGSNCPIYPLYEQLIAPPGDRRSWPLSRIDKGSPRTWTTARSPALAKTFERLTALEFLMMVDPMIAASQFNCLVYITSVTTPQTTSAAAHTMFRFSQALRRTARPTLR